MKLMEKDIRSGFIRQINKINHIKSSLINPKAINLNKINFIPK